MICVGKKHFYLTTNSTCIKHRQPSKAYLEGFFPTRTVKKCWTCYGGRLNVSVSQNLVNFKRFVERTIKYNYIQSDGIQSKYIFLNRLSSYRNVKIRSVFFESLKKMGFSIHDPASMNIFDQIRMFYGAKVIVGIGGAAWANIIFTKASITSIVSIASAPFDVHRNIAEIFNLNYSIIASSALEKNLRNPFYRNFVHSNFSIDRNCEDMIIQDIVDKIQKL